MTNFREMSVIFILAALSILLACGFLAAFLWAMKSGQYEDNFSPSARILFEDEIKKRKS